MQAASPRRHFAPIVVWPFVLIGVGVTALLVNTGVISWDSLARIAGLWPVLLIVIGAELIVSYTAPRPIALPVNISISTLATIGALVLMVSGASWPLGSWWPVASLQTITRSGPLPQTSQAQLNVNYGAAQVTIHADSIGTDMYRARLTYAGNPAPSVWVDSASGTLHVDRGARGPFQVMPAGGHEQVDLVLSDRIPWSITLNAGASQQTLDLRGLTVSRMQINAGASSMEIDLPKPSGSIPVAINGGAMSVHMLAPSQSAVQVVADGGFNSLQCDGQAVSGMGRQNWESTNFATSTDRYQIQFSGGASSFRLERW